MATLAMITETNATGPLLPYSLSEINPKESPPIIAPTSETVDIAAPSSVV